MVQRRHSHHYCGLWRTSQHRIARWQMFRTCENPLGCTERSIGWQVLVESMDNRRSARCCERDLHLLLVCTCHCSITHEFQSPSVSNIDLCIQIIVSSHGCICFVLGLSWHRIVVLVALHIHYIREFTYSADKGVAIATPIMFRQAESLFSLLSASGPPLNQYLRRFQTTDVATFGFAPKDPSNQTSTASELRSHVRNSNLPAVVSPGQGNYEVAVESDNNYGIQNPDPRDSQYDGRSGSHNMTIKQGTVSRIDESYVKQDFDDMILDTSILNR